MNDSIIFTGVPSLFIFFESLLFMCLLVIIIKNVEWASVQIGLPDFFRVTRPKPEPDQKSGVNVCI